MNFVPKNWLTFDGKKYQLKDGDTALDSMLRGGANLTFSCRKGSCRSCMLEAVSGDPGIESQEKLPQEMRDKNLFLPCVARNMNEVEARIPDLSQWFIKALIVEKNQLSPDVWQFMLEPETNIDWRAGQYTSIRNSAGDVRSYSVASSTDDYFMELHIRHYPDGKLSNWMVNDLKVGDIIDIQGPTGTCYYDREMAGKPLLLVGVGTGAAPLIGIAKDALSKGHVAPIEFFHGAAAEENLYLIDKLSALAAEYPNFKARSVSSQNGEKQQVVDIAFGDKNLKDHVLFIAGNPNMVEVARIRAVYDGAKVHNIHADPFDTPGLYQPCDAAKMKDIKADPEFWAALDDGKNLSPLLDDFYTIVFEDPRLAPFFHKVTKKRLVEKQYEFLKDLLTGTRTFFGEKPFRSHHWMVISDELFDYREGIFFEVAAKYNLPEGVLNRWAGLHETFRREIVKPAPRGIYRNGVEQFLEGYSVEEITVDTICDGCFEEIRVGETGRMHTRTGELFCTRCEAG